MEESVSEPNDGEEDGAAGNSNKLPRWMELSQELMENKRTSITQD